MNHSKPSFRLMIALLLAFAASLSVSARVFTRVARDAGIVPGNTPGWTAVYTREWDINGRPTRVRLWNVDRPPQDAGAEIRRHAQSAGEELKDSRAIVLPGGPRSSIVVEILRDGTAPLPAPSHRLAAAPPYPGSAPSLYASDDAAGFAIQCASARAAPEDIRSFYDTTLAAQGWSALLPSTSLRAYARRGDVILVTAESAGPGEPSRIILAVQKRATGASRLSIGAP